jgi:hypothetical protein
MAGLLSQNFFVTTDLRGVRSASVRNTPRYSSTCAAPVKHQRAAQPRRLVLIGLASGFQNQGDVLPSRSRQVGSVDDVTLDILDAIVGIDAERGRNLRGGGMRAAGGVRPGHEMIAAEDRPRAPRP